MAKGASDDCGSDFQSVLIVIAEAAGITDVVTKADAVARTIVLAEMADLTVGGISDDRFLCRRIHPDNVDRARQRRRHVTRGHIAHDLNL